jgi:hypothetical protein
MRAKGNAARAVLLDAWPLLLAGILVLPLLSRSGYPLARDLLFVPHLAWSPDVLGLGDSAPRAVPLDALVSLLTFGIDGGILARVVLPLLLASAGWGTHRLVAQCGTVARMTAAGLAVWNPYVVERLALGQWALLIGYAALPWVAMATLRFLRTGGRSDLASTALWTALAAVTPTGGLLAVLTALACGAVRTHRTWWLVAAVLVMQLPWLTPSLFGAAALTSDPAAVQAFAPRAEGPGGSAVALLGLGGIWDAHSVPPVRETWVGTALALLVVAVVLLGLRELAARWGAGPTRRLATAAAVGLGIALAATTPWGSDLLAHAVETVPGAGLLRDTQKLLAPYAVLFAACGGAVAQLMLDRAARFGSSVALSVGAVCVALPALMVPDATTVVWPTMDPVDYPRGFDRIDAVLDRAAREDDERAFTTLPWRAYRNFSWGNGLVSADPAPRWFARDAVVDDDLQVGSTMVAGENVRARRLGSDLANLPVSAAATANGIGWVVVYRDDPSAGDLDLSDLDPIYSDAELALYRVPGPAAPDNRVSWWRRATIVGGDLLTLAGALGAALVRIRPRRGSRRTAPPG